MQNQMKMLKQMQQMQSRLAKIQADMHRDSEDERILVLPPAMTQVWARKPL